MLYIVLACVWTLMMTVVSLFALRRPMMVLFPLPGHDFLDIGPFALSRVFRLAPVSHVPLTKTELCLRFGFVILCFLSMYAVWWVVLT